MRVFLFQRKIIISLVKHRSTTLLYGAADVVKRYQSPESYIRQTQLKGLHVKGKGVATDSKWMPTDECIKMLNHMYDYQRFYNKYLTPQEREKAWASFALKHSSILKKEHSSERTTALYELLSTHQILEQKFGKKLLRYWGRAIIKDLKSLKKKPKASCKLIINNDHYLKLLKGKTKKKYLMLAKATTTHPKNLKDFEALNRFKYLLQSERKNAKKAEKIKFNSYNFQERRKAHHVENAKKHIHKYRALTRNYPKAYINKKVKEHIWLLEEKYSL